MKTNSFVAGLLSAVVIVSSPLMAHSIVNDGPDKTAKTVVAKAVNYTVDTEQSSLTWNAKKVGGEHTGTLKLAKGQLTAEGNKLTAGNFMIDMTTIVDTDITNPSGNKRLTDHLKSEDFFSVEKNPTATFKITKVTPVAGAKAGEPTHTVTGDLSIKGTTKSISFPAAVNVSGNRVEATGTATVNRLDYDIKYRAAIIGTAADKIIDDTFTLNIKLIANKGDKLTAEKVK
ncbi:YceI family protein [Fibrisoma montanum]|uniref:YceI family protein n=1 Tax=Fibrisoma montanum TaxID=2305895 RepID=A0A418M477_9BACT|nr:YceI family protein [Fibrisoma montanum]RIV20572.1 YceI family protein [Fibrisoma montanum]